MRYMASVGDTTGVGEQGMYSKGELGNLREPTVSLWTSGKPGGAPVSPESELPAMRGRLHPLIELVIQSTNKEEHTRYRVKTAKSE